MSGKTRRPHRKSRNGCIECKHRHIRCDERQPSCANCEAAERICSFLTPKPGKQKQRQGHLSRAKPQQRRETTVTLSPGFEPSSQTYPEAVDNADEERVELAPPVLLQQNNHADLGQAPDQLHHRWLLTHNCLPFITGLGANTHKIPSPAPPIQPSNVPAPPADCCPGLSIVPDAEPKAIFTPQHMILMHHANSVPNLTAPNRSAVEIAVRHAIDSPYLIDEVLAFTAFHMTSLYPGSAAYLRHLSIELQTRALASFTRLTEMVPKDDRATAVQRFLFSGILGRHVLAETLTHCSSDFHFFIDRLIECINLNRGIRTVTPPAWAYLSNTEMQPFMRVVLDAEEKITSSGRECDPLSRVMDESDLNEASVKACRQAIEVLQWSYDLCHNLHEDDYPQSASAFSVRVGADFLDVLRKHRPEALLVLAYYGVLLYRCRGFKAFGDAGAFMIRAIAGQVGRYWQEALAWPLQIIETEHN